MNKVTGKLTVFFEGPFWVGVFERVEDGRLSACRVVFGAEPRDGEVWEFLLEHYRKLVFSPAVEAGAGKETTNPKRLQREARKKTNNVGTGTRSQQALQLQREQAKVQRRERSREEKAAEQERQYAMRKQKRRDKHRGR